MGVHQKHVVEAFIHDEVCFDFPNSKKTSHIPATTARHRKPGASQSVL
jgi:hypothetical protein